VWQVKCIYGVELIREEQLATQLPLYLPARRYRNAPPLDKCNCAGSDTVLLGDRLAHNIRNALHSRAIRAPGNLKNKRHLLLAAFVN
jgi:hypothetical protein